MINPDEVVVSRPKDWDAWPKSEKIRYVERLRISTDTILDIARKSGKGPIRKV